MSDIRKITGYAHTHGAELVHGHDGWTETISREALEQAVAQRDEVPLRLGPDGPVVGVAHLSVDDTGLRVDADMTMNWSFRVKDQDWNEGCNTRDINELSIDDMFLTSAGDQFELDVLAEEASLPEEP